MTNKINIKIKVKKFIKKTCKTAKRDLGLSKTDFDKILSFIKDNKLDGEQMLYLYSDLSGNICVALSEEDVPVDNASAPQAEVKRTAQKQHENPTHNVKPGNHGDYLVVSMQPGNTPNIHGASTNPTITGLMGIISVLCGGAYLTMQICSIVFSIQDRRKMRTCGKTNNSPDQAE